MVSVLGVQSRCVKGGGSRGCFKCQGSGNADELPLKDIGEGRVSRER